MPTPHGPVPCHFNGSPPRILLLMPSTSYRAKGFMDAVRRLGVQVTVGSNHRSTLQEFSSGGMLPLEFEPIDEAVKRIVEHARRYPVSAVIGTDEESTILAATTAAALGLRHNSVESTVVAHDKYLMRCALAKAGFKSPKFERISVSQDPGSITPTLEYPLVVKPLKLCGSRGVIKADNADEFVTACRRAALILKNIDAGDRGDSTENLLVESFIPGREVAVEGILCRGKLTFLALFDKPDPLDGPFFEETIYVTPSRLPADEQELLKQETRQAALAIGLSEGPIHAELRINRKGAWIIEIAARSIGGLCSRALRFQQDLGLDDLIVRHAVGLPQHGITRDPGASGVMMIPIQTGGRLNAIEGLEAAKAVPKIDEITINVPIGNELVPLPEGGACLGFIFATARTSEEVEYAIRTAHSKLEFKVSTPTVS